MEINLESPKYKVISIFKATSAEMFKDVKTGDIVQFNIPLERSGRSCRGTYAAYITAKNLTNKQEVKKSFNEMPKYIKLLELEQTT